MALELAQHLVHHADLPIAVGAAPISEEGVRLVDDQEAVRRTGLGEGSGDLLLGLSDPLAHEFRSTLRQGIQTHALRELFRVFGLPAPGRTVKKDPQATAADLHDPVGQRGEIGVGVDQRQVVLLCRLRLRRALSAQELSLLFHRAPCRFGATSGENGHETGVLNLARRDTAVGSQFFGEGLHVR